MSSWGCPHNDKGQCRQVPSKTCDTGMKGCTLFERFVFSTDEKNISRHIKPQDTAESDQKD
jgi:hypothetical protein